MIKLNCKNCKKEFKVRKYRENTAHFCSYSCNAKFNLKNLKEKIIIKCITCNKNFKVIPARKLSKFCSQKCYGISRKGKKTWNTGLKGYMSGKNHQWYGINRSGENSPVWIKDRTQLKRISNQGERRTSAYFYWRKEVWKRDNYKCKINNKQCKGRIEAHHILGFKDYLELRYDINNGITLCHFHHPRVRKEEKRLSPYFMELVSVSKE